jgi:hypothetical protein
MGDAEVEDQTRDFHGFFFEAIFFFEAMTRDHAITRHEEERLVHLLQRRTAARADKDYATADQLSLCSEYTHKHKSVNKHTHTRKKGSNA